MPPSLRWREEFENYLANVPIYYYQVCAQSVLLQWMLIGQYQPLRNALKRINIAGLIPEHLDASMNLSVMNYLKKIKIQVRL